MCAHPFQINQPISADRRVQPEDILRTKQALNRLGYYKSQYGLDGGWVDNDMFSGIRQLQKDNGLKVDGVINPEGETSSAMNRLLMKNASANDNTAASNDNDKISDDQLAFTDCDGLLRKDERKCFGLGNKQKIAICLHTAMDRYGNCLANRMLRPPLFKG